MDHNKIALKVFDIEKRAIENLSHILTNDFENSINTILNSNGRVIICGMGKSGIISRKIAASLASTGTPSFFMHPGEGFHGDLGMVTKDDIFIAISNSGETDEVLKLLPFLKDNTNCIISLTGNPRSTLAKASNYHLNVSVPEEACPLQLAPTSSTTAALVMGDAITVALMEARGFQIEHFARFHPGGCLGRRLLSRVSDEMITENLPVINSDCKAIEVLTKITKGQLGLCIVIDKQNILGLITDGDIRRVVENNQKTFFSLHAKNFMNTSPVVISSSSRMETAFELMDSKKINRLLVVDDSKLVGVLKK